MICPHGVDLSSCLACPVTTGETADALRRWSAECEEWDAIAREHAGSDGETAIAASITEELRARMHARGERAIFETVRGRRVLQGVQSTHMGRAALECPHGADPGQCRWCTNAAAAAFAAMTVPRQRAGDLKPDEKAARERQAARAELRAAAVDACLALELELGETNAHVRAIAAYLRAVR